METTTQEKLDVLTGKLVDFGDRLLDAAEPAGRMAWEASLHAIQLQAVFKLALGGFVAVVAVCLAFVFCHFVRGIIAASGAWDDASGSKARNDAECRLHFYVSASIISGFLLLFTIPFSFMHILSTKVWIAAVAPEASIALRILNM